MDPTPEEQTSFTHIDAICAWLVLAGPAKDAHYALLGLTGAEHPRVLAALPQSDYQNIITRWEIAVPESDATRRPTPAEIGKGGWWGVRAAWCAAYNRALRRSQLRALPGRRQAHRQRRLERPSSRSGRSR